MKTTLAWKLARAFWALNLDAIGNHFEDVAVCGHRFFKPGTSA